MKYLRFRTVQFLWLIGLFLFGGVSPEFAFAQTQTQTGVRAGSLVQARRDQEEQIVRLAAEIEKVKKQQQIILEEIDRTKKFLR